MKNLDQTAKELFAKIRGRFPGVTIGDGEGNVTQEPTQARFFEFPFREGQANKISISLSEDDGVVVMHNKDVAENEVSKSSWYDFLKELRVFAKKRMLNFETRDINKSNLEKRDYQYLANRSEEDTMNESKLYGTSRVSYQNVDNARLVIKHTESVNTELASGRTQKIGKIYIESADGERFMYPYKHLSGARAMARHVAEGGKPFDDFGKHITGLSEELSKLRKFKTYMGRSGVMAESLSEYVDVVKERIQSVKKTVESLQKPNYYKEAVEGFEAPMLEDVPDDVRENWIDQLTIKQFNEELADVFPYIYKLVSEATKAKELGPEDLEESPLLLIPGVRRKIGKVAGSAAKDVKKGFDKGYNKDKTDESDEQLDEVVPAIIGAVVAGAARAAAPALSRMGASILAKRGAAMAAAKGAGQAAGQAAGQVARGAGQAAGKVAKGAGNFVARNPGTTAAIGGGAYVGKQVSDTIDDLATSANEIMSKASQGISGIQDEISAFLGGGALKQIGATAAKYGLPVLAAIAILYGGKKVINWLMGKGKEPKVEDIEIDESALMAYAGKKKHGAEYMKKAAQAGREGASQEELGRLKDKYSKAEKKKSVEEEFEERIDSLMGQFAEGERHGNDKIYDKCWKGYRKVPGKKRGEEGSCKKIEGVELESLDSFFEGRDDAPQGDRVTTDKNPLVSTYDDEFKPGQPGLSGHMNLKTYMSIIGISEKYQEELAQAVLDAGVGEKISVPEDARADYDAEREEEGLPQRALWIALSQHHEKEKESDNANEDVQTTEGFVVVDTMKTKDGMKVRPMSKVFDTEEEANEYKVKNPRTRFKSVMSVDQARQQLHPDSKLEGNAYAHAVRKAKMDGKKKGDKIDGPDGDQITLEKEGKLPVTEFILSYFDRETGQFPKGETAVLTMVEKDYGEEFIEPAKAFIEQVNNLVAERYGYREESSDLDRIKDLAGL